MAVPTHFRFTVRGVFLGTPEAWSFGMHFSRDNPAGADANIDDVNQGSITSAIDTFVKSANAYFPANAVVSDWRMYQIGTDNRMEGNPLVVDVSALNIKSPGTPIYPPQVALCVTTVGADRGPGRLGRFYLPTRVAIDVGDRRILVSTALDIANQCSTFMKSVSNAIDLEGLQSSEGLNISQSGPAGARQAIDHIEVGRVLDTLRNRRKSMVEDRQSTGHIDW